MIGRRHGDVGGRRRAGRVVGQELVAEAAVHVSVGGRRIALVVQCRTERRIGGRLAGPRLNLRPGEDRPALGMVGDFEPRPWPVAHACDQLVAALGESVDQPEQSPIAADRERRRDVDAVEQYGKIASACLCLVRQHDLDQRVAVGHEVGPIGQHTDLGQVVIGLRRRRGLGIPQRSADSQCNQRAGDNRHQVVSIHSRLLDVVVIDECVAARAPREIESSARPIGVVDKWINRRRLEGAPMANPGEAWPTRRTRTAKQGRSGA
jgi:hypothetical protein